MLREGEGWRKGETWSLQGQPGWANQPEAIKIQDSARRSQERSTVPDDPAAK